MDNKIVKTSIGIALCRYNNNNIEILLIKKRFSYHFYALVMGHYKKSDLKGNAKYIKFLFDNMNYAEKIDLLGMQFSTMWYRIWLNNPEKYFNISDVYQTTNFSNHVMHNTLSNSEIYKSYFQKRNKFENNFLKDNGKKLRSYIQSSTNSEIIWEIPKGHIHGNETHIDCAIREFYEETSIKYNKYRILHNIDPITDESYDGDIVYKSIYYVADLCDKDLTPRINFKNLDQIVEVDQIKWVSINEIKFMNLNVDMHNKLVRLYGNIINKYKQVKKLKNISLA